MVVVSGAVVTPCVMVVGACALGGERVAVRVTSGLWVVGGRRPAYVS